IVHPCLLVQGFPASAAMHQDHSGAGIVYKLRHAVVEAKATNIVDDLRPRFDSTPCDAGPTGIDGNRNLHGARQSFENRYDPPDFFLFCDRYASRSGGLAANINNVGAMLFEFFSTSDRCVMAGI